MKILFFQFEESLCSLWDNAMNNGDFWYTLDEVKTKLVSGKHKFVAQVRHTFVLATEMNFKS